MLLTRYFNMLLMRYTLILFVILFITFSCIAITTLLDDITGNQLTMRLLFTLWTAKIPLFITLYLPVSFFLAIMLTLKHLQERQELIVAFCSGFSLARLHAVIHRSALFITALMAVVTLWVQPQVTATYQAISQSVRANSTLSDIPLRHFQSFDNGQWTLFANSLSSQSGGLGQLFLAKQHPNLTDDPNERPKWEIIVAKRAKLQPDNSEAGSTLTLEQGKRFMTKAGSPALDTYDFSRYSVPVARTQYHPRTDAQVAATSSITLWQHRHDRAALSELGWRVSLMISPWLLAMLAIPLSRSQTPRKNQVIQLIPALCLYCVYACSLLGARYAVTVGLIPIWLNMWWVHVMMLLLVSPYYLIPRLRVGA